MVRVFAAVCLVVALCMEAGWAQRSAFEEVLPEEAPALPEAPPEEAPEPEDPVAAALEAMDLRLKVAQLMLVTPSGLYAPSAEDMRYLRHLPPAGVVIRRLVEPGQAASYVTALRELAASQGVPMLLGANLFELVQRDRRAPSAYVQLPGLLSIAAAGDAGSAQKLGEMLARQTAQMGFNLHMGPSLELAPVLPGVRGSINQFGSSPAIASDAGVTLIKAFQEHGVSPVPMGFPGGGADRRGDSEAVLLTPLSELHAGPLMPYKAALAQGVQFIHVGNTLVPTLEKGAPPASLSRAVMQGLLREQLDFEGFIIAGPLDTEDIAVSRDTSRAAVQALGNGADLVYWRGADTQVMEAVMEIVAAVESGLLPEEYINDRVKRLLTFKFEMKERDAVELKQRQLDKLADDKELAAMAYAVERSAITLVKNNGLLPLREEASMPIAVTGVAGTDELREVMEEYAKPISQQRITTALHLGEIQDFEIDRLTRHMQGIRTVVCVLTNDLRPAGVARLMRAFKEKGAKVAVVLLGYPALLPHLQDADAILVGYSDNANYARTMQAMGEILMGEGPLSFMAIDKPLHMRAGEERSFDVADILQTPGGRLPVSVGAFAADTALRYNATPAVKKARWEFGDGKGGKGLVVRHAYKTPGTYQLRVEVTDQQGETSSASYEVIVTG